MSQTRAFPSWILDAVSINRTRVDPKSLDFFEKLTALLPSLDDAFLNAPATAELGVLKSYDPYVVQARLKTQSPIELILLNVFESLHFQFRYQFRELALSQLNSLTAGQFYVAALTTRAMLEVVSSNYYTFSRADGHFKECLKHLDALTRTKSEKERSRISEIYYRESYEMFSKVWNANTATSINWSKYLLERFNTKIPERQERTKIHVNTALERLEKSSKLPLTTAYSVLSEFVHPNAGSKMLIAHAAQQTDGLMDVLTIGDNKGNAEAALFYVDHLSESMYYCWNLALSLFHREQKLLSYLGSLGLANSAQQTH